MKTNLMKKVLGFVLTLVMVCSMLPMTSNAAEGTTVYLAPGVWDVDSAWFAAYYFGGAGSATWAVMEVEDGNYVTTIPEGYTTVIFCRMSKEYSKETVANAPTGNHWSGKWDQTADLPLPTSTQGYKFSVTAWPSEATGWKSPGTWGHAYTDGVCTLCGAYEDGIGAKLAGYSLSVDGKIGVNFYMELDAAVVADASSKMQFTLPDGSTSDVLVSAAKTDTIGGKTYYVFTCKVAAKEMASDIKGKIVTSTGEGTEYTYTVRDYADALIAKNSSAEEVAFVKAMLNYGAASQKFFNFNASDLVNKNSDSQTITAYTATDLVSYKPVITDDSSVLSNVKSNLVLESGTKLNVKFTAAADATITLNDNAVSATGTNYVISIDDLNATELDKVQTVKVNTATIACSPLSYCYSVLATSDDANLKEVVCALYDYNKAADAYIVTQ